MHHGLSDTQKLLRLVHIERLMEKEPPGSLNLECHKAERARLLAGVGMPPASLMRTVDPHVWADAFCAMFRHPDPCAMLAWFEGAQSAAYDAARHVGRLEGRAEAQDNAQQLVRVLCLVRAMLKTGRAKAENPRDDSNPDAAPQTLLTVIEKALLPYEG